MLHKLTKKSRIHKLEATKQNLTSVEYEVSLLHSNSNVGLANYIIVQGGSNLRRKIYGLGEEGSCFAMFSHISEQISCNITFSEGVNEREVTK